MDVGGEKKRNRRGPKTYENSSSKYSEEGDNDKVPITKIRCSGRISDWDDFLLNENNLLAVAPVRHFLHAPFATQWDDFVKIGALIEIPNPFIISDYPVYWIAQVIDFKGYRALVSYNTLGVNMKFLAWISYFSEITKPLGYSFKNRILLYPPTKSLAERVPNFCQIAAELVSQCLHNKDTLIKTIEPDHVWQVKSEIRSSYRFELGTVMEAMDPTQINRFCLVTVTGLIGNRVHVTYTGTTDDDENRLGYWFSSDSDGLHSVGFCHTIGHDLYLKNAPCSLKLPKLPKRYFRRVCKKITEQLQVGCFFEARHPLLLHIITIGQVKKVLKYGYFIASFKPTGDCDCDTDFLFHIKSPYILPCGFCEKHELQLTLPTGTPSHYNWNNYSFELSGLDARYLQDLPSESLPLSNFSLGSKMEAVDVTAPTFLGPATVVQVAGHLIKLHFDGWSHEDKNYQWVSSDSSNLYPLGWAELVGHEFHGSPSDVEVETIINNYNPYDFEAVH